MVLCIQAHTGDRVTVTALAYLPSRLQSCKNGWRDGLLGRPFDQLACRGLNTRLYMIAFTKDRASSGNRTRKQRRGIMGKKGEIYSCGICGQVVEVKKEGGGELVCCGEPMKKE
ncbi:MAG: desulfoferrodoxin FeS4 iron-binding domain-containing protein [Syntrophotaleaceae bacterium]